MSIDIIGNFLTIIRNGIMRSKSSVVAPYSRLIHEVALVLKQEGFIQDIAIQEDALSKKLLKINLKYVDGESVIHELDRKSKPGRRVYQKCKQLKPVVGKLGVAILSTNKGVMTDKQAKQMSVGGEIMCSVW